MRISDWSSDVCSSDLLDAGIADDLAESYRVYRTIEHRLQMVDDQQTHAIPRGAAAMDRVAQLHGLVNGEALLDLLRRHVERTGRPYDGLVADSQSARLHKARAARETWL